MNKVNLENKWENMNKILTPCPLEPVIPGSFRLKYTKPARIKRRGADLINSDLKEAQ